MKLISKIIENTNIIFYFLLSIFTVMPFFSSGFFQVHDDVQVARIYEMGKSLSSGMFPVRWVQDLGYGAGYPIFNFYSVLPYYIGGFLMRFGGDPLLMTKTVFIFGTILSGMSMYIFIKSFFGKFPALVSGVVYLYFPYHAVNIYVRGDLAELWAYAFLPFVFLGLYKIHSLSQESKNPTIYICVSAISIAAVALSHNLSAFMLGIFMGLFVLSSLIFGKKKRSLVISYTIVFVLSFLLSAFYAIPAIAEMRYANVLSQVGGGSYYADHFVCLQQLWNSPWGFGGSAPGCVDGISFKLGKLNIILILASVIVFFLGSNKLKEKRFTVLTSFSFLILSVFMMLDYSQPLWRLPYMDFLQFPWRFMNFTGLFISVVAGFLIWFVLEKYEKLGLTLVIVVIALTIFINGPLFTPQTILNRTSSFYTNLHYLNWTASKISDEYMPKNFTKPQFVVDVKSTAADLISGKGEVKVLKDKTGSSLVFLSLVSASTIRLNIAYFPAWKVFIDEKETPFIVKSDGMYVKVSAGRHNLSAKFVQTNIEMLSNLLSIVGVLALIAVIMGKSKFLYGKKTS